MKKIMKNKKKSKNKKKKEKKKISNILNYIRIIFINIKKYQCSYIFLIIGDTTLILNMYA